MKANGHEFGGPRTLSNGHHQGPLDGDDDGDGGEGGGGDDDDRAGYSVRDTSGWHTLAAIAVIGFVAGFAHAVVSRLLNLLLPG